LTERHPRLPTDEPISWSAAGTRRAHGYLDFRVDLQEHSGTHVDAPLHFADGLADVAGIPVGELIAPLCVVDISTRAVEDPDCTLKVEDLRRWESHHGRIPLGAVVAMNAGWASFYDDPDLFLRIDAAGVSHFPGWSLEAAVFLLRERNAAAIAVDTLSIDTGTSTTFPVHHAWLGSGRWAIENVANLDGVPAAGATLFIGLPKISRSTGFPARLIAMLPASEPHE
jgi:kynurenine formamidase